MVRITCYGNLYEIHSFIPPVELIIILLKTKDYIRNINVGRILLLPKGINLYGFLYLPLHINSSPNFKRAEDTSMVTITKGLYKSRRLNHNPFGVFFRYSEFDDSD